MLFDKAIRAQIETRPMFPMMFKVVDRVKNYTMVDCILCALCAFECFLQGMHALWNDLARSIDVLSSSSNCMNSAHCIDCCGREGVGMGQQALKRLPILVVYTVQCHLWICV